MEDFTLLGNAAAVPVIIAVTQLLKKNFTFKYKADVVSFVVALIICPLWWFYNTPEVEIIASFSGGNVATLKFIMGQLLLAVATFMSASKSYDLFSGNKKRADRHDGEKQELHVRIAELEDNSKPEGVANEQIEKDNKLSDKLLNILEGR